MNCPVCKTSELISTELEPELSALQCSVCNGHWISGRNYWRWLEEHSEDLPERVHEDERLALAEPGKPIDCPECRFRMVKYLVGRGLNFTVDHCHLNSIFTSFWQTGAEREARKIRMEQRYIARFGADDYAEIKKIRWWLETKTNREELLAYLTDQDPFDV